MKYFESLIKSGVNLIVDIKKEDYILNIHKSIDELEKVCNEANNKLIIISYEELLNNTELVIKNLMNELEISIEPFLVNIISNSLIFKDNNIQRPLPELFSLLSKIYCKISNSYNSDTYSEDIKKLANIIHKI